MSRGYNFFFLFFCQMEPKNQSKWEQSYFFISNKRNEKINRKICIASYTLVTKAIKHLKEDCVKIFSTIESK